MKLTGNCRHCARDVSIDAIAMDETLTGGQHACQCPHCGYNMEGVIHDRSE